MLSRREFVIYGGAALSSAAAARSPTQSTDPIWGVDGAATRIIRSLQHLSQTTFKAVDFPVTRHGARQCRVVAQSNPYTDPLLSPLSAGAERTAAPDSFDSRPAFLAAIAACHAAGGGRVLVPSGNWYCAGPIVLLSQ